MFAFRLIDFLFLCRSLLVLSSCGNSYRFVLYKLFLITFVGLIFYTIRSARIVKFLEFRGTYNVSGRHG